jgi:hypothetical protein
MLRPPSLTKGAFFLAIATWVGTAIAEDKDVEHWRNSTWRVVMNLDTPNLLPPAVQWTFLDKDPLPGFAARVQEMAEHRQSKPSDGQTASGSVGQAELSVAWDLGFKEVTGDRVHLLTAAPGVHHIASSTDPGGKKWIVTKTTRIKGKLVCWSIPIEVATGKEIQINLTEKNMIELESVSTGWKER